MKRMSIAVFHPAGVDKAIKSVGYTQSVLNDKYQFINAQSERLVDSKRTEFCDIIARSKNQIMMAWMGGQISCTEDRSSIQLVKALDDNDWDCITRQHPNIIGSSDITFLLCDLLNHNINCFYGPNFKSTLVDTCDSQREITIKYLMTALEKNRKYTIRWKKSELNPDKTEPWTISSGKATGRLIGGNVATLFELYERR